MSYFGTDEKFPVVLCDPPWSYGKEQHSQKGPTGCADHHYPTMSLMDLCAMPVKLLLEKNALIYMWTTGPQLQNSMALLSAWGAPFKTAAFVWEKGRVNTG